MAQIFINGNRSAGTINKNIYGQFAEHLGRCIYGGLANADGSPRADAVAALRELGVPVLRWPGGCFADDYHWKDGVGPKAARKTHRKHQLGRRDRDNAFGTHEFLELCAADAAVNAYIKPTWAAALCRKWPTGWST